MEVETREMIRSALFEAADQIDISDDLYEAIGLVTHFLEEQFEGEIFADDLAMKIRIQEIHDQQ